MTRNRTLLILLTLVVLFSVAFTYQSRTQQWEYKFEYSCKESKANELGLQNWEMVTSNKVTEFSTACVFKRPKS